MDSLMSLMSNSTADDMSVYEMQLEDYFKPDAELECCFNAIDIICNEADAVNGTLARLEVGDVKMNSVASSVACTLVLSAAPTLLNHSAYDVEHLTSFEVSLTKELLKSGAIKAKNLISDLLTKAINFVMDYYRKFKVGGKKAIEVIDTAIKTYGGRTLTIDKPSTVLQIGDDIISSEGIEKARAGILSASGSIVVGSGLIDAAIGLPNANKVTIVGNGKLFALNVSKSKLDFKSITLNEKEVISILKASKVAIQSMMELDHRRISSVILDNVKKNRKKEGNDPSLDKYYAKALRSLTVKLPAMLVSGLAKVPSTLKLV